MATEVNWSNLLDHKYASYKVEVNAFLDSLDISNSTNVSMAYIYDQIRNALKVDENLKLLYHEAVHGSEKSVKLRIKKRLTNLK